MHNSCVIHVAGLGGALGLGWVGLSSARRTVRTETMGKMEKNNSLSHGVATAMINTVRITKGVLWRKIHRGALQRAQRKCIHKQPLMSQAVSGCCNVHACMVTGAATQWNINRSLFIFFIVKCWELHTESFVMAFHQQIGAEKRHSVALPQFTEGCFQAAVKEASAVRVSLCGDIRTQAPLTGSSARPFTWYSLHRLHKMNRNWHYFSG